MVDGCTWLEGGYTVSRWWAKETESISRLEAGVVG